MIYFGKKFTSTVHVDELASGKIYLYIEELGGNSYSSAYGFNYHFMFNLSDDPSDNTRYIGRSDIR